MRFKIYLVLLIFCFNSIHAQQTCEEYLKRGMNKHKKWNYDGAVTEYEKALELNPQSEEANFYTGNAKFDMEDFTGAINNYSKLILINSNHKYAYYNRGNAYYHKKEYDLAISDYNRATKINPNITGAYNKV